MQIRNNYDIYWESVDGKSYGSGVYNGDLGIIKTVTQEYIEVIFDDRIVKYETNIIEEIEHAYAITIHKSQGSEFPVVVMVITSGPPMLYTRNLLYTGVTRAKELLIIVGKEMVINRMIDNIDTKKRNTGLKYKLEKFADIFNAWVGGINEKDKHFYYINIDDIRLFNSVTSIHRYRRPLG